MAGRIQLRMYTINKGQMDEFLKVWREGVVPVRERHGFHAQGGWVVENENRFVWMLAYDGDDWEKAEEGYFSDPVRKNMNPSPSSFVAHMELRFVHFEDPKKA